MENSLKIKNVVWLADQLHSSMRMVVVVSEIRESGDSNPDFVKLSKSFGWLSEGEVDFEDQIQTFFFGEEEATADFLNLLCGRLDSAEEEFTKIVKRLEPELELLHSQPIQITGGRAGKSNCESLWWWADDLLSAIQEESAKFAYEKEFSFDSTDKFFLKKFVCGICESVLQDFPEFDGHFIAQAINQELAKIDRKRIVGEPDPNGGTPAKPANGPDGNGLFHWNENTVKLSNLQQKAMKSAYGKERVKLPDFCEFVWEKQVEDSNLDSFLSRLNTKLEKNRIP